MAVIRTEKNSNYTVMSNRHLKDTNLSLKAKGLLSMILALPNDWDYSVAGLVSICKESETAVKSTIDELKEHGYMSVSKERNDKGQFEYVYTFFETPEAVPAEEKPLAENPAVENPPVGNVGQLNTNKSNTKELNSNTYCSELEKASEPTPNATVITLTLNTNEEYPIYQTDVNEWQELYPAVDIMQELRKMKGWCNANPKKRKTKNGIKRFINSWLSIEQDKGGSRSANTGKANNTKSNDNKTSGSNNRFNNFPQREYSDGEMSALEKRLLGLD